MADGQVIPFDPHHRSGIRSVGGESTSDTALPKQAAAADAAGVSEVPVPGGGDPDAGDVLAAEVPVPGGGGPDAGDVLAAEVPVPGGGGPDAGGEPDGEPQVPGGADVCGGSGWPGEEERLGATDGSGKPDPPVFGRLGADLADLAAQVVNALAKAPAPPILDRLRDPVGSFRQFASAVGLPSSPEEAATYARTRLSGDYEVDEFGFDPVFTEQVFLPLLRPLVQTWFRVEVHGAENLPLAGPTLLVANHAGTLPLDGMVLHTVVFDEIARHVRMLGADLIFATPFSADLARRTGTTLACQEDAERLLAGGHLVAVYPEGFKGLGKPYADRYKLQRFGRGGFVSAAVRASVPIVPVSIVGSEEIYPLIAAAPGLARALGVPYFPLTPLFPWLGVLGLVPLPSKWIIQFGEAIATDELPSGAAEDPMTVFEVTDQVRETIQQTLYALLAQRPSTFL